MRKLVLIQNAKIALILLVASILNTGCAVLIQPPSFEESDSKVKKCIEDYSGIATTPRDALDLQQLAALSKYYVKTEIPQGRSQELINGRTGRPKLCIALSGGGQRSAAFGIGVMAGMESKYPGLLAKSAYLSGVSGGGYATAWVTAQSLAGNKKLADLFDEKGRAQTLLSQRSEFGSSSHSTILSSVFSFLGMRVNSSFVKGDPLRPFAQLDLSGTGVVDYGMTLCDQFLIDIGGRNNSCLDEIKLADLSSTWKAARMPYPIWGITGLPIEYVSVDGKPTQYVSPTNYCPSIRSAYFEWTLDRLGNSKIGYLSHEGMKFGGSELDIVAPVVVSAAAADNPYLHQAYLGAHLSFGDGVSLDTPPAGVSERAVSDYWLMDGGNVENLAVFPLVMRGCEEIVVVDGEFDPHTNFDGYKRLRDNMAELSSFKLSVPAVENLIKDNGIRECVPGATSSGRWNWKPSPIDEKCVFSADAMPEVPVFSGEITLDGRKFSKIQYIKLSLPKKEKWPRDSADLFSFLIDRDKNEIKAHTGCNGTSRRMFGFMPVHCRFPQESTANQALSSRDWEGYAAIGRWLGRNVALEDWPDNRPDNEMKRLSENDTLKP